MRAHKQLERWLLAKRMSRRRFATERGITETFAAQLISGDRIPGLRLATTIERMTGVPAAEWAITGSNQKPVPSTRQRSPRRKNEQSQELTSSAPAAHPAPPREAERASIELRAIVAEEVSRALAAFDLPGVLRAQLERAGVELGTLLRTELRTELEHVGRSRRTAGSPEVLPSDEVDAELLEAIYEAGPGRRWTAGEIVRSAKRTHHGVRLRASLIRVFGPVRASSPKCVGRAFTRHEGRAIGALSLLGARDSHRGQWVWMVTPTEERQHAFTTTEGRQQAFTQSDE